MLNFLNFTRIFLNVKLIKIIFDLFINYRQLKSILVDRNKDMTVKAIVVFMKIKGDFTNNHYFFW